VDKSKSHEVDVSYYTSKHDNLTEFPLIVHDRDCSVCSNEMMRCHIKTANINITVERLALEFTNDAEVSETANFMTSYLLNYL